MYDPAEEQLFLADCPARLTVEVIADKWSVVVLAALSRGPRRHGELVESIGGISRKVLTQTLRRLQAHGLVRREPHPGEAHRAQYELTPLGSSLTGPVRELALWARVNGEAVLDALEADAPGVDPGVGSR
ncbi:winged helix-turn-helix transcriptional regulator [Kineococcus rhizosphaerae]|uniref:winged helix-turn-helix transcriptional regulator n=1 Tax=Kineococcus rhizosphaerae TaxID=559628 RepID=UPI000D072D1D|nr:helix-turn-helix domain-containing protein [Kineococcus rhizosphaerae]